MYTNFHSEYEWSKQWIPLMTKLIGQYLLRPSTLIEDREEATDLIMLMAYPLRIACRVRHPGYAETFGDEITITARRENGQPCEYPKIAEQGWANWLFYGHATSETCKQSGADIFPRYLVNLHIARQWIIERHGPELGPNKDRPGRRCWFYAYSISQMLMELGPDCIIASNPSVPSIYDKIEREKKESDKIRQKLLGLFEAKSNV